MYVRAVARGRRARARASWCRSRRSRATRRASRPRWSSAPTARSRAARCRRRARVGDHWLVDDGLKAGDRVIVEGLQRMRPGSQVQPVERSCDTRRRLAAPDGRDRPAAGAPPPCAPSAADTRDEARRHGSRFFIDRPDLRVGDRASSSCWPARWRSSRLPIAQYPSIAPPAITITATYPGASAKTLEDTVTQVIEQQHEGHRRPALHVVDQRLDRPGARSRSPSSRHRPRHRAGAGAEQAAARRRRCCRRKCSSRACTVAKSATQLPAWSSAFVSEDGSMTRNDIADYVAANLQDPISARRGRRRASAVRRAVRDAHLARPGQARQLPA